MNMHESFSLIPLPTPPQQAAWRRQGTTVQIAVEEVSTQHRKDFCYIEISQWNHLPGTW